MKVQNSNIKTSSSLVQNRNDISEKFSGNLNDAYRSRTREDLQNYINEIKKKGNRLVVTKNYIDVISYKKLITKYLKDIVDYTYSLNKNTSFWESQYFTTVETINQKLDDLTRNIMDEQKENIDMASTIDNIQGLLVDIYK
ncbi:DUF327 family protein [Romboutsia weinsteinii]|uniref:DUF327 family protein n=1 Tax=Romboutsia weinsteinii TaxID=2020949 RepID=A0A255IUR9_9FIRM|nr:YaaR family protein [Romboutsia weinsteinii]RDY28909.1 DUF327 family protein [Romboutsia weinsteinii]